MKKRYYAYIGALCSLLAFAGCDKESDTPEIGEKVPITLSASFPVSIDVEAQKASAQGIQTRAETIHDRTIGVVAVKAEEGTDLNTLNWGAYYLDHVRATGTNTHLNVNEETVRFNETQWWPFHPTEYLAFVAYSPYPGSTGDTRVSRVDASNTLRVTSNATGSFPDFIYTVPVGPWNKEDAKTSTPDKALSLGEFQHAMSKLDIKVILVDKNGDPLDARLYPNPNGIRITELKVSTEVNGGTFDLIQPTLPINWTLDAAGDNKTVRTHISSATTLVSNLPIYSGCYLLPGTEDNSSVSITIQELDAVTNSPIHTIEREAKVNEFLLETTGGAKLEMGKTTLLTIKVKYVPIPDPKEDVILEGQLVEWDYKGESTVTIE